MKPTIKTRACLLTAAVLCATWANGFAQAISTVQFTSAKYTVNENAGTVTLTVERIGDPGGTAYVEYATYNGTATNGADYVEQTGFLQFIGETNLTIVIPILNDAVAERDETFSVSLFNPDTFDTRLGALTNAVVTILDNDRGVEFSSYSFTVDEGAGMAVITVRGGSDSTNSYSVDYSTTDGCSAIAGVDYVPQSGTLNFAPGEMEKTIMIPILDDALVEGDETVKLSLSHPVGVALGALSNAVLRIRDKVPLTDSDVDLTPQRVGIWSPLQGGVSSVAVAGNYAYVSSAEGLQVLDVSDPTRPRLVGQAAGGSGDVAILCDHAVITGWGGLEVFDVSNPANPRRVGEYNDVCAEYTAAAVEGNRAYLAVNWFCGLGAITGSGMVIIDISDAANPRLLGTYSREDDDWWDYGVWDVAVSGEFAYLASAFPALEVIDISDPANPQQVGDSGDLCIGETQDLALSGDFVYITDDIIGLTVIDISNPTRLQQVGDNIKIGADLNGIGRPRLAVAGSHLCVVASVGLVLFDIREPIHPRWAPSYATEEGPLALAGDHAYLAKTTGLEIIDLNPLGFLPGSIMRLADGQVQLTLNTRSGQSYTVQASTNLVDWETLETRTPFETKLIFTDTNAPNFDHRFYRAVSR